MTASLRFPVLARATAVAAVVLALTGVAATTVVGGSAAVAGGPPLVREPAAFANAGGRDAAPAEPRDVDHVAQTLARLVIPRHEDRAVEVPLLAGNVPVGKGMWIYIPEEVESGDVHAVVARAQRVGLTHVYVRTGSSRMGFYAQRYLDELLPVAHAAGLEVLGWDFPYFRDVDKDVKRSLRAISYETPSGDRLDGFVPDIEPTAELPRIPAATVSAFGRALRAAVGPDYPLLAAVPRVSSYTRATFPFGAVAEWVDAMAPMVYWMSREPAQEVTDNLRFLARFGKPLLPIGQAYDGGPEGGPPGVPGRDALLRFTAAAYDNGAVGVSFWSWQHADREAWGAIRDASEFRPDALAELLARLN